MPGTASIGSGITNQDMACSSRFAAPQLAKINSCPSLKETDIH